MIRGNLTTILFQTFKVNNVIHYSYGNDMFDYEGENIHYMSDVVPDHIKTIFLNDKSDHSHVVDWNKVWKNLELKLNNTDSINGLQ